MADDQTQAWLEKDRWYSEQFVMMGLAIGLTEASTRLIDRALALLAEPGGEDTAAIVNELRRQAIELRERSMQVRALVDSPGASSHVPTH